MQKQASTKPKRSSTFHPSSNLSSFIKMAIHGHYPLFYNSWFNEYLENKTSIKSTQKTKKLSREIIQRMDKHRSIDRKRTILMSLNKSDRMIFINEFLLMVESQVLDRKPGIH